MTELRTYVAEMSNSDFDRSSYNRRNIIFYGPDPRPLPPPPHPTPGERKMLYKTRGVGVFLKKGEEVGVVRHRGRGEGGPGLRRW